MVVAPWSPAPAVTHVTGGKTDGGHDPAYTLVLQKFHPKVRNHGEGPY